MFHLRFGRLCLGLLLFAGLASLAVPAQDKAKVLRAGIIGLDTSHALAFTALLNDPRTNKELGNVRVVAAYPGGSPDLPESYKRLPLYTQQLRDTYHVEIVDSISELLQKVDVVLLESVDGRKHLEQAVPVFQAGKPVFIDKPFAASLLDALRLQALARKYRTPCFSSSALRFCPGIARFRRDAQVGEVIGCDAWGPCLLEPHHPDLFWYGIHGVEILYTVMGPGCVRVSRTFTEGADVVVGVWKDGRLGTFRGLRAGQHDYGAIVFGSKAVRPTGSSTGYYPLVAAISEFFRTGKAPVSLEETVEIIAFMEAAQESRRRHGQPVTLASVRERAQAEMARTPLP